MDLNQKETESYLRLLELWSQPISVLAKHVNMPRSSMYLVLDELIKKWFVESFKNSWITYVKSISPDRIKDLLNIKKQKIDNNIGLLNENLSKLKKIESRMSITPKITFYEWKDEVMKVYENVLKEKWFVAIFNPKSLKIHLSKYLYALAENIKKNWLIVKELVVDWAVARDYKKQFNSKNHQIIILPKNIEFESDTIICEDKIYMLSYGKNEISAIEIYNISLTKTQRIIFYELWDKYKSNPK